MKTNKLVSLIKEMSRSRLDEDNHLLPSKRRKAIKRKLAEEGLENTDQTPVEEPKKKEVKKSPVDSINMYPEKKTHVLNR